MGLRTEDITALNEDMLSKYQIIEDLQADVSRWEEQAVITAESVEAEKTLNASLKIQEWIVLNKCRIHRERRQKKNHFPLAVTVI